MQDSNLRLLRCKRSALPAELIAHRRRVEPGGILPYGSDAAVSGQFDPSSGVPRITGNPVSGFVGTYTTLPEPISRSAWMYLSCSTAAVSDSLIPPVGLGDTVGLFDPALGLFLGLVDPEAAFLNRLLGGQLVLDGLGDDRRQRHVAQQHVLNGDAALVERRIQLVLNATADLLTRRRVERLGRELRDHVANRVADGRPHDDLLVHAFRTPPDFGLAALGRS